MLPPKCSTKRPADSISKITEEFLSSATPASGWMLKIVANHLSVYCEAQGILSKEQCSFRPRRSAVDMLFVVRRVEELG